MPIDTSQDTKPEGAKPFRILSIDGGGMKGVYACAYLQTLERHFNRSLHEHFDMVAGTSTGGIIALGIGAKRSAAEILGFYQQHGPLIFPRIPGWKKLIKRIWHGHGYANSALKGALSSILAGSDGHELTMSESVTRLCVPSVNAANCEPRVFKSTLGEPQVAHLNRDLNITMTDVAMASSAAPWYLPIASVTEGSAKFTYIDGGLWANNPSVVAVTEALTYYSGNERDFDCIHLLSIALPNSVGYPNDGTYQRGMQFVDQLLSYAMESSKLGAHQTTKFLLTDLPNLYYRAVPTNLTEAQKRRLGLDSADAESIEEFIMLGQNDAENHKNSPVLKNIFK